MHAGCPKKAATGRGKPSRLDVSIEAATIQMASPNRGGLRATLLVGASVLAVTSLSLAPTPVLAQSCVPSNQVITTSIAGPVNSDGGSITITGPGSVTSVVGRGVEVGCPATWIDNSGVISSGAAVVAYGSVGILTNSGTINGTRGIWVLTGGAIGTVSNSGTVDAEFFSILNDGSIGTLTNNGSISSTANGFSAIGISNAATISTLSNSGSVSSIANGFGAIGVRNAAIIGTLSNSGAISGTDTGLGFSSDFGFSLGKGTGISSTGTIGQLTNSGAISGTGTDFGSSGTGIFNSGTIGQLGNSGSVSGAGIGSGFGIDNTAAIIQLANSGAISGTGSNAGTGISSILSITELTNSGAISGIGTGTHVSDRQGIGIGISSAGTMTRLTNSGTISGTGTGDRGGYGSGISSSSNMSQLTNSGTISGTGTGVGFISASGDGISSSGTVAELTNSGVISGTATADALTTGSGISNLNTITQLANSGTISGTATGSGYSIGTGISNDGTIGQLINSGTISGFGTGSTNSSTGTGISNTGTINRLSNSGTISGTGTGLASGTGISNHGTISQLTNSGTIRGTATSTGVCNNGTIDQLTNSGTISDNGTAISNRSGTILGLTNSGTISGGVNAIISSSFIGGGSTAMGPITNSGVIQGNIEIQHQDVTIFGGTGGVFGALTGGTMTIANGDLLFASGNQLLAQNITVNDGRGTVTNASNLMLSGPQSISGNYVQGSAGSLIISVGAVNAGRLDVSGTATFLDATVAPRLLGTPGSYVPPFGQRFQVINAQGGVRGGLVRGIQPDDLGDPGVRFDLPLYSPNSISVLLTPSRYGNLATAGITASAAANAVGSGLDAARPGVGATMTPNQTSLYTPLYTLGADQIAPTLEQMAPVIYADALTVNRSTFQMVSTAINRELEARRGAPPATRSSSATGPQDTTIWLGGIGQFLRLNGNSNDSPGYSGSSGGVVAGIDGPPWPDVRIGAAFGFSSQNISTTNAASYRGNAAQFQVYGSARHDIAFVDVQAGGVFTEGTARRSVFAYGMAPEGNVSGSGGGGSVRGGVRVEVDGWNLEPSVLLGGLALGQGGVAETNGGPVGMQIGRSNIASLQSLIGIRVDRRVPVGETTAIVPSVRVGWGYEMLDTRARTTASFLGVPGSGFDVSTPSLGRSTLVVGAQAALDTGTALQLFASYTAALNSNATAQTVTAGLRYTW